VSIFFRVRIAAFPCGMASDEVTRKAEKPVLPLDAVPNLVSVLFGKRCGSNDVLPLESYDDLNFRVTIPEEAQLYTLKVHNGCESDNAEFLEAQTAVLEYLHEAGLIVPVCVPQPSGRDGDGGSCTPRWACGTKGGPRRPLAVRLMRWVPGVPLGLCSTADHSALRSAGAYLAKMRMTLDSFDHPGAHRFHQWDLRQTHTLRPFMTHIANAADFQLVTEVVNAFESVALPLGTAGHLPSGVLHADYNDYNLIVSDQDPTVVAGVVDFGDMVHSWRVNDIAIAAAYACVTAFAQSRPPDTIDAAWTALLRGFGANAPRGYLTTPELDCFRLLCCCRLAISVTLGAYSHSKDPSNAYLMVHAQPGWTALRHMWRTDAAHFRSALEDALNAPAQ